MVGWHHRHSGPEFEQVLGVGDGQGSLVCCSPWGQKELDTMFSACKGELNIIMTSASIAEKTDVRPLGPALRPIKPALIYCE